eukprot:6182422-Pleurochrysis_carterae.AAC.2
MGQQRNFERPHSSTDGNKAQADEGPQAEQRDAVQATLSSCTHFCDALVRKRRGRGRSQHAFSDRRCYWRRQQLL